MRQRYTGAVTLPHWGTVVVGVAGFSGAGKTTLLCQALPRLLAQGLAVAVVKHDAHGFSVDQRGKDSYRLFTAGGDVVLVGEEAFARFQKASGPIASLEALLPWLAPWYDLLLLEGHSQSPVPKVWLQHPEKPGVRGEGVALVLPWGQERLRPFVAFVEEQVARQQPPLWVGVLVGGRSTRLGGRAKQLLRVQGKSLLRRVVEAVDGSGEEVVYVGRGPLPADAPQAPQLPDPPGFAGPVAGMLAALAWQPRALWLFLPTDMPFLGKEAVDWLLSQRRWGVWGVIPVLPDGKPQPLFSLWTPQGRNLLATCAWKGAGPRELVGHPKVAAVPVPEELAAQLRGVNTPDEWRALTGEALPEVFPGGEG